MKRMELSLLLLIELALFGSLFQLGEWQTAQIILLSQGGIALGLFAVAEAGTPSPERSKRWVTMLALVTGVGAGIFALSFKVHTPSPNAAWPAVGALLLDDQREVLGTVAAAIGVFSVFGTLILARRSGT